MPPEGEVLYVLPITGVGSAPEESARGSWCAPGQSREIAPRAEPHSLVKPNGGDVRRGRREAGSPAAVRCKSGETPAEQLITDSFALVSGRNADLRDMPDLRRHQARQRNAAHGVI